MNIEAIRARTAYNPSQKITTKQALQGWLCGCHMDYQVAVTLTLKQSIRVQTDAGTHFKSVVREDCSNIAKRFTQKLNREVFGHAAKRHNKSLRYLIAVEGVCNSKNLHLHMAIGNIPRGIMLNKVPSMVHDAITRVHELDQQHAVDVMDSGWFDYITKELSSHSTDNVLWELA